MFKLVVSDTVLVNVKGSITDSEGRTVPFDFGLEIKREPAEDLERMLGEKESEVSMRDFLRDRVTGWRKVLDENGAALDFSTEGLRQLFQLAGMPQLCFRAYLATVGVKAKEKN